VQASILFDGVVIGELVNLVNWSKLVLITY